MALAQAQAYQKQLQQNALANAVKNNNSSSNSILSKIIADRNKQTQTFEQKNNITTTTPNYAKAQTTTISNQPVAKVSTPTVSASTATQNSVSDAYAKMQQQYQSYLNQLLQSAQKAYNNNKYAINNGYNNQRNSINSIYGAGKSALDSSYAAQQESLRKAQEEAKRQAYVNRMQTERNLNQALTAQGITGGASESTLAKVHNNYLNSRGDIEQDYGDNLTELAGTYNASLADLQSQYNSLMSALEQQKMQYDMQNENALANNQMASIGDYANYATQLDYNKLTQAMDGALALAKMPEATNTAPLVSLVQGLFGNINSGATNTTPYDTSFEMDERVIELRRQGLTDEEIRQRLGY